MKLICFPYAGGTSYAFLKWRGGLDPKIELVPVELPGRGKKGNAPLSNSIDEAINSILPEIIEVVKENDYAFYGHSMGTILVLETIQKLQSLQLPMPKHVFLSGRLPPHIIDTNKCPTFLNDEEFMNLLISTKSYSNEFLNSAIFKEHFLHIVKSDFRMVEKYSKSKAQQIIDSDVSFLFARNDIWINKNDVLEWENYTKGKYEIIFFEGGHMFLLEDCNLITNFINQTLIKK